MMNGKPLVIDGYCGLGGWTEGFLAEGWECIGIDIERHDYGSGGYPGHLILQDARKAASAAIAKIPFPLARWIARVYRPAKVMEAA